MTFEKQINPDLRVIVTSSRKTRRIEMWKWWSGRSIGLGRAVHAGHQLGEAVIIML